MRCNTYVNVDVDHGDVTSNDSSNAKANNVVPATLASTFHDHVNVMQSNGTPSSAHYGTG